MNAHIKNIVIMVFMIIAIQKTSFAQNFYRDYENYLQSSKTNSLKGSEKNYRAKVLVSKFKDVFDTVEQHTGIKMLNCDTLFIVSYSNGMSGVVSILVWNRQHSCYYQLSSNLERRLEFQISSIEVNANSKVKGLDPDFKAIVEKTDTVGYFNYIQTHFLPDETSVRFTVAHKEGRYWSFVSSKSYSTSKPD